MKSSELSFGWVDLAIVGLLIVGLVRGRKRGMSEELLDLLKWILILAAGAFAYEPLGSFLSGTTMFSRLASYVATYFLIMVVLMLVFAFIRRQVGGKLLGSDLFGNAEYYLGMGAGFIRYSCILLVTMALLNARYYSPAEVKAHIKYQEDNFGSIFFPTLCSMQNEVFAQSFTGRLTREYLGVLLIKPTSPEDKSLGEATLIKARERNVYDVLEK